MNNEREIIIIGLYLMVGTLLGMMITIVYCNQNTETISNPHINPWSREPEYYYLNISTNGTEKEIYVYESGEYKKTGIKWNQTII